MTTKGSFYVDIYNCYVNIVIADDMLRSINHHLRKLDDKVLTEEPGAYFISDLENQWYYLFFKRNDITINLVNHEKSHLVEAILEERGIKARDETRAYLDGFLSAKINDFFKKRKIKIK